ncbi:putative protein OS=Streptomyces microflavus OX=1919 GN=Smic_78640 PE=4 SV=1 [Streptomyces microflavus]|uniref:Uncharacterized protein n=1 Tax=Streptomyces microflavus TaxID=1919 RepID=A0A7J0D3N8_STRMI|nr:hypothetical protein Smic_78640 [Streptomyces microflavus]
MVIFRFPGGGFGGRAVAPAYARNSTTTAPCSATGPDTAAPKQPSPPNPPRPYTEPAEEQQPLTGGVPAAL